MWSDSMTMTCFLDHLDYYDAICFLLQRLARWLPICRRTKLIQIEDEYLQTNLPILVALFLLMVALHLLFPTTSTALGPSPSLSKITKCLNPNIKLTRFRASSHLGLLYGNSMWKVFPTVTFKANLSAPFHRDTLHRQHLKRGTGSG